jgi:tripartite-type tricarboxylate transporter receptor subunit TctC
MLKRRTFVVAAGCGLNGLALRAETSWPNRPIRILVGFSAGSSPDLLARTIGEPLSKALGQPMVIENRVGAGSNIAADVLAKSDDNHTIGVVTTGPLTTAKLLNPSLPFDPERDLAPLTLLVTTPLVLVVPVNSPGSNAVECIQAIKEQGGAANYGSVGIGSAAHLGMELFKSVTGVKATHIPYVGTPQITNALISGEVQLSLMVPAAAMPFVRAGRLRALGVTSATRSSVVPEVPSLNEAGISGYSFESWNAACAPSSMPLAHRKRLESELQTLLRLPDIRAKLNAQGWQVAATSAEGLATRIREETATMRQLIRDQHIKL